MQRRDFLRCLLAAPLAILGLAPERNRLLDEQWHHLRIVDGAATVDGLPWRKPWLYGGMGESGGLEIHLDRPNTAIDIDWVSYMEPRDGSGPRVFEARFRASDDRQTTVAIHDGKITSIWRF